MPRRFIALICLALAGLPAWVPLYSEATAPTAPDVKPEATAPSADALSQGAKRLEEILRNFAPVLSRSPATPSGAAQDTHGGVNLLRDMARSEDPATRLRAIELWKSGSGTHEWSLLIPLLSDPAPEVRDAAANAMARSCEERPDEFAEQALLAMQYPDSAQAQALAGVLPMLRGAVEGVLIQALTAAETSVARRAAAAACLGAAGSEKAVRELGEGAWDADPVLALACVKALASIRSPECGPVWQELLTHADPAVRLIALDGIVETGGAEVADQLRRIAAGETETDGAVKASAIHHLAGFAPRVAVPMLVQILVAHPPARAAVAEELKRLTGMDFGTNPVEWQQWLEVVEGKRPPPQQEEQEAPTADTGPQQEPGLPPLFEVEPWRDSPARQ